MTDIPELATIKLANLQRAALASLLKAVPPDYTLQDLLDLVLAKGLCIVLHGRALPPSPELEEQATASVPLGRESPSKGSRLAADFIGFQIDEEQQAALKELEERFPLVDDDEVGRILLDCALRALPHDDLAQRRLKASFVSLVAPQGDEP